MRSLIRVGLLGLLLTILTVTASAQEIVTTSEQVTYTVQRGDTLFRIALRYGVNMDVLAQANSITDASRIKVGQTLVIPGLVQPDGSAEVVNPLIAATPVTHTVQRGEILSQIASKYGVTVEQILAANNLANPDRILAGQTLQIWVADTAAPAAPVETAVEVAPETSAAPPESAPVEVAATPVPTVMHTVAPGEYLSGIARRYNVSWTTIAEANSITDPNQIHAGMQLIIPNGTDVAAAVASNNASAMAAAGVVAPGAKIGTGREIVVDLSSQMTYAYENGALQRSVLVSTGLPATPTVQGTYAIYRKLDSQTMSGPGYYLPGVQWVMYFYQGYAVHGTYWHTNFGQPMSHGCVNMTNDDALWFYNFASIGTPVTVVY
jgi:LysM repeat protein